jgi:hypothetical protein
MRNGIAYRLPPLVRLTDATGSGSWPTPTSRDWRSEKCSPEFYEEREMETQGKTLAWEIGGALNPQFVSWLMGFPLDWCDMPDEQPQECPTASQS